MTLVLKGPLRIPGPFGMDPLPADGSYPGVPGTSRGPAGYYPLYDKTGGGSTTTATKATKARTFKMPHAFDSASNTTKIARVVEWPLFGKGGPKTTDVAQGGLANCPLPAILAAMANTASGRQRIQEKMITEHGDPAVTDLSDVVDEITDQTGTVSSKRYFTVKLGSDVEVTDVLYTDDASSGWGALYMHASGTGAPVLWACIIEKAYAVQKGGYAKLDEMQINKVWKDIMGAEPDGFKITEKTELKRIREQVVAASNAPTVLASKDEKAIEEASKKKVVSHHGYAVLGMKGNMVNLYNPWGKPVSLPLTDIPKYFQAMFYP